MAVIIDPGTFFEKLFKYTSSKRNSLTSIAETIKNGDVVMIVGIKDSTANTYTSRLRKLVGKSIKHLVIETEDGRKIHAYMLREVYEKYLKNTVSSMLYGEETTT